MNEEMGRSNPRSALVTLGMTGAILTFCCSGVTLVGVMGARGDPDWTMSHTLYGLAIAVGLLIVGLLLAGVLLNRQER